MGGDPAFISDNRHRFAHSRHKIGSGHTGDQDFSLINFGNFFGRPDNLGFTGDKARTGSFAGSNNRQIDFCFLKVFFAGYLPDGGHRPGLENI